MDATIINSINLLSPENMDELRLFLNSLLKKQEKTTKMDAKTSNNIEPDSQLPIEDEDIIPLNPLEGMGQIPVPTDIIINRYSIYEDNFIDRL